jgi:hypothetical protein
MKILGMRLLKRVERVGNEPDVPLAQNLGVVDFFKQILKEAGDPAQIRSVVRAKAQESSRANREQGCQPNGIRYQEGCGTHKLREAITVQDVQSAANQG